MQAQPPGLRLLCLTQHQGPLLELPSGCGPLCLSSHSSESDLTPVMVKTEARPASRVGARGGQPVLAAGLRPLSSECGPWSCQQ